MNRNPNPDGLERFVEANREAFDYFEPDPKLWDRIEADLDGRRRTLIHRIPAGVWQLAASIVLVVGAYLILDRPVSPDALGSVEVRRIEADFQRAAPELAQVDADAQKLITRKVDHLAAYESLDPKLVAEFRRELAMLDSMNVVLKQELLANPHQENLAEALRLNLQMQLDVVNQQLGILKELKAIKADNAEKNPSKNETAL